MNIIVPGLARKKTFCFYYFLRFNFYFHTRRGRLHSSLAAVRYPRAQVVHETIMWFLHETPFFPHTHAPCPRVVSAYLVDSAPRARATRPSFWAVHAARRLTRGRDQSYRRVRRSRRHFVAVPWISPGEVTRSRFHRPVADTRTTGTWSYYNQWWSYAILFMHP